MAETITATTEEKVLPGKFQQYYQTFFKSLMGDAGFKEQSPAQIKNDIVSALLPAYEKARANRIAQTGRNAAMIDTDAAARGMGSSTWVTDVKNRLRNQEAADLANLESDYAGNIYNALLNRLDAQDNKRMALQNTALSTTQGMYDKWLSEDTAATSGSSGGSSSRRSPDRRGPGKDDPVEMTIGELSQLAAGAKTAEEARQTYNDAISGYNGQVKVTDYNPATHDYYIGKTIKDTTSGKDSLVQKVIDAVKAKRKSEKIETAANRKKTR